VLLDLHVCDAELETAEGQQRQELVRQRRPLRDELSAFFGRFNALVADYVRMPQKHLWL
jgi:hypothetical protein